MGLFDVFTDPIENGFNVIGDVMSGEVPDKREVASLISAGLTAVAISEMTGVAVDVVENMMED